MRFAGDIMSKGGISKRLSNAAKLSLGNRTGVLIIITYIPFFLPQMAGLLG